MNNPDRTQLNQTLSIPRQQPSFFNKYKIVIVLIIIGIVILYTQGFIAWQQFQWFLAITVIGSIYYAYTLGTRHQKKGLPYILPAILDEKEKIRKEIKEKNGWDVDFTEECRIIGEPEFGFTSFQPNTISYLFKFQKPTPLTQYVIAVQSPVFHRQKGLGLIAVKPLGYYPTETAQRSWTTALKYPRTGADEKFWITKPGVIEGSTKKQEEDEEEND